MEIAEKIQRLMDEKGITAYRLSKETGVSYTGLSKILNLQTKNPQIDSLKLIADYFDKPIDYFMDVSETPEWANSKDKRDFKKMLEEDGEVMFDGMPISDVGKQRVMDVLTGLFWEAKEMNKKKYGKKKQDATNNPKDNIKK